MRFLPLLFLVFNKTSLESLCNIHNKPSVKIAQKRKCLQIAIAISFGAVL